MSTYISKAGPTETTLHLGALLATHFPVAIKHGTIGGTPREVIQGSQALLASNKTTVGTVPPPVIEKLVTMKIQMNITIEEAGGVLAEHYSEVLGLDTNNIEIRMYAPVKTEQNVDITVLLNTLITPMFSDFSKKLTAIKTLRLLCKGMSLSDAKWAIENWPHYLDACIQCNSLIPSPRSTIPAHESEWRN